MEKQISFDAVSFMAAVAAQDADDLRSYFAQDAVINWHDSNESFTVDEYIRANCEYPGDWQADVIRAHDAADVTVFAAKVYNSEGFAVHVASFVTLDESGKILRLDEYFSECGEPPQWRRDMEIGRQIV